MASRQRRQHDHLHRRRSSNAGPSAADGAVVSDPAAAGLSKTGVTCAAGGRRGVPGEPDGRRSSRAAWRFPTLPSGGSVTFTITATVTATGGSVSNAATVAAPGGVTDPNAGNNTATDTDAVGAVADLSVTKTNGVAGVNAGSTTTYTVVVTNAGPSAADGAVVSDPAATGLTQDRRDLRGRPAARCARARRWPASRAASRFPTLPSGGSVTFTVTADRHGHGRQRQQHRDRRGARRRRPIRTRATTPRRTPTPSAPVADLSVTKTNGVAGVNAGSTTTYTVVVDQRRPERGRRRDRQRPGRGRADEDRRDLRGRGRRGVPGGLGRRRSRAAWRFPTLPSGGSVTFTITATVTATGGSVSNVVDAWRRPAA